MSSGGMSVRGATPPSVPSGARMLFQQSGAPVGWAKDSSSHDNKALRVVTGSVVNGGTRGFTTLFSSSYATASFTLLEAHVPNHNHGLPGNVRTATVATQTFTVAGPAQSGNSGSLTSFGSDGGHQHSLDLDLAYCDNIICTKS